LYNEILLCKGEICFVDKIYYANKIKSVILSPKGKFHHKVISPNHVGFIPSSKIALVENSLHLPQDNCRLFSV